MAKKHMASFSVMRPSLSIMMKGENSQKHCERTETIRTREQRVVAANLSRQMRTISRRSCHALHWSNKRRCPLNNDRVQTPSKWSGRRTTSRQTRWGRRRRREGRRRAIELWKGISACFVFYSVGNRNRSQGSCPNTVSHLKCPIPVSETWKPSRDIPTSATRRLMQLWDSMQNRHINRNAKWYVVAQIMLLCGRDMKSTQIIRHTKNIFVYCIGLVHEMNRSNYIFFVMAIVFLTCPQKYFYWSLKSIIQIDLMNKYPKYNTNKFIFFGV